MPQGAGSPSLRPRSAKWASLGGDDRITGGAGSDRLFGGDGEDIIEARDGQFDVVDCEPGADTGLADSGDLIGKDCERVTRA